MCRSERRHRGVDRRILYSLRCQGKIERRVVLRWIRTWLPDQCVGRLWFLDIFTDLCIRSG